ncbi:hypothetical protein [uncultured Hyphomonas sp.]|uniref:hypothetical protein n=1 Tax=uncultured Hyphomonas sp. TaxID=225298 RepID=UPI0026369BF7|nr:hypothetical protein [uncultured Hyphomonas sp.]
MGDWFSINKDGIWCDFCGNLLEASFNIDEEDDPRDHVPECCRECGAPDDFDPDYFDD